MDDRFLYAGLIRLHLLHHVAQEPIYGLAMIEELGRHGYRLSAGTFIRSCMDSRRRDISPLRSAVSARPSSVCIEQRRPAAGH